MEPHGHNDPPCWASGDLCLVSFHQTVEPVDQLLQCVDPAKDRELWVKDNKTGEIRPVDLEIWARRRRRIMPEHCIYSGVCPARSSRHSRRSEGRSVSPIPLRSKVTVSGELAWATNDVTEPQGLVCVASRHAELAGITIRRLRENIPHLRASQSFHFASALWGCPLRTHDWTDAV